MTRRRGVEGGVGVNETVAPTELCGCDVSCIPIAFAMGYFLSPLRGFMRRKKLKANRKEV